METLFFLIIIGILSAVFGRRKASRSQSRNKSFLPDNLKDIRTLFNQQLDNYSTKRSHPVSVEQREFDSIESKYIQAKESVVPSVEMNNQPYTEQVQAKKVNKPVKDIMQVDETSFLENVDEKTLINGIIWAEILGEPRSKKPYFARKS